MTEQEARERAADIFKTCTGSQIVEAITAALLEVQRLAFVREFCTDRCQPADHRPACQVALRAELAQAKEDLRVRTLTWEAVTERAEDATEKLDEAREEIERLRKEEYASWERSEDALNSLRRNLAAAEAALRWALSRPAVSSAYEAEWNRWQAEREKHAPAIQRARERQ